VAQEFVEDLVAEVRNDDVVVVPGRLGMTLSGYMDLSVG
jgi:hypothetical protein